MIGALALLVGRVVVVHLVIVNGTNDLRGIGELGGEEGRRREFGSKMILIGRTCYALFLWFLKFGIVSLYERIAPQSKGYRVPLKCLSTGQVYPDPGETCHYSEIQLYTSGACNIVTDLILMIYPLPIIFRSRIPTRRKLQIGGLFSLTFFAILASTLRLPFVMSNNSRQRWRALFAWVEMLVACFVANAPDLYRAIGVRANGSSGTRSSGEGAPGRYWFTANRRRGIRGRGVAPALREEGESEGVSGGSLELL
ncbi:unnamed protein product [Tuber melanosporum]|uniref:(Perigord truffle) hypothetical protein n=1 Tax=Tuber melanosporum (strain Mel28) TaxID=656061 RepID=D5GKK9_TUBMM|nr:uncharacterized protein GSTUM_00009616001 [Tuber melanosporum]CAZ85052.1 unnamed protein product [Tuber melanosporum]